MTRFPLLACLLAILWLPSSASAATASGADLLGRCTASEKSIDGGTLSADETLDAMWCMGYVSGLLDGFSVGDFRVGDIKAVCPTEESLTRIQAMRIITKWLREHPDELQKSGRRSAVIALSKAFPCKREEGTPPQ